MYVLTTSVRMCISASQYSNITILHTYIPLITVTVPRVLVVFGVDRTIHWKVVVQLIENTVNENVGGLRGLFS